jgi:trimeric autotransporter adhesin
MKTLLAELALPLITLTLACAADAQCGPAWWPGAMAPGPLGVVRTVLPLSGGDIVVGGSFAVADATAANNIARWDGSTWRALGSGANSGVTCLVRLPGGDLVAGGFFGTMGGQPCNRIARWNGASWSPIGAGFSGPVFALRVLPNGDLVAAGQFAGAVARWNGATWSPLGQGLGTGIGNSLALRPNGELIVGGSFAGAGPFRWDGVTWSSIAGFDAGSTVSSAVTTLATGSVAIVGTFAIGGQPRQLAIWNGGTLQPLAPPPNFTLTGSLLGASNGDLVLGGFDPLGTIPSLVRWNGTTWATVPGLTARVYALVETSTGSLLVGSQSGPAPFAASVLREEPNGWRGLGAPPPPDVRDSIRTRSGDVVVGGSFASFGGSAAANLARWDGSAWSGLGAGVDGPVRALANAPNGDLVVGGNFQQAGGAPAARIARWNGAAWSTLGGGLPTASTALAVTQNGYVYALDESGVLRQFRGTTWSTLEVPGFVNTDAGLAALPNGDLAVSTFFAFLVVYRPSTGAFTLVPDSPPLLRDLLVADDGALLTAGSTGVHRWDGTNWTQLLAGAVESLALLPGGDLLAAGAPRTLAGSASPRTVYRLGTGGWAGFATIDGIVHRLTTTERGEVFASGPLTAVEGAVAVGVAVAQATCPAVVQVVGSGCTGGAGPVTLRADSRPWVGGSLRTTTIGMTTNSLALQLAAVQATQLALPGGAAGCSLFGVPILSSLLVPTAGVATGGFDVPPQPSLAGQQFRLQTVGIELDAAGIVRLTSSNGLELSIGLL